MSPKGPRSQPRDCHACELWSRSCKFGGGGGAGTPEPPDVSLSYQHNTGAFGEINPDGGATPNAGCRLAASKLRQVYQAIPADVARQGDKTISIPDAAHTGSNKGAALCDRVVEERSQTLAFMAPKTCPQPLLLSTLSVASRLTKQCQITPT